MVQFNSNLNVVQTFQLNSTPQVTTDSANDSTNGAKAEKSAVWKANRGSYYNNSKDYNYWCTNHVLLNDVLELDDGTYLRCIGIDEDGRRQFEKIMFLKPGDDDHRRGGNCFE